MYYWLKYDTIDCGVCAKKYGCEVCEKAREEEDHGCLCEHRPRPGYRDSVYGSDF